MHQSNAAATVLYDHSSGESLHNADSASGGDPGDAVMARWLQSAGLRHLASTGIDQRHLSDLLMQGYGAQSAEEKQRLVTLMRNCNFNGGSRSEPCMPTGQRSGGFFSPDFRGDIGFGLLDLHAMDDTELLSEHVMLEPFRPSLIMPDVNKALQNQSSTSQQQRKEQVYSDAICSASEKETSTRENNVAKIKVVVRKRPLNKKEISRKEDDIVIVKENSLTVHEPKLKVDLTAYVEKHEFCFDAVLDEHVTNDEVYRETVEPIIPIIFQRTKATCFAYGQTGSGKTFTMQPLPIRAAQDLVKYLHQPVYRDQKFKLWLGFFEIYGGKLYDLLSERKRLFMREDGKQQVCIVGLQEFEVSDVQMVKEYIEKGNAARSTGSTGANEESSRSHAILQLVIKKHSKVKESKRNNDGNESKAGKVVGKISFIDLAGSERGADTTDNDRQTRIEGAEINKSLLALKECIRALDNDQIHIPFRGSKLTEVLRDSFVGHSRTVMISCISPNAGSCEHTLNTLRYADRVKSLSRSANSKKDQSVNSLPPSYKDASPASAASDVEDAYEKPQEVKVVDVGPRLVDKNVYNLDFDNRLPSTFSSSQPFNRREESGTGSGPTDKERFEASNSYGGSTIQRTYSSTSQTSVDTEEKVQKVSPPRRKSTREENSEIMGNWIKNDGGGSDLSATNSRQANAVNYNRTSSFGIRPYNPEPRTDGSINSVLEEEEALTAAHRKEIEDTMEIVREEMKLLAEVDQPGSQVDSYVTKLSFVLSRKAASLVSLQARLARFQHRLKEEEILNRKRVPG
ncbi:kinesin-like protein KIN-13A [Hibiscus syriacus]|uniref:kinesin-like protein KIN-13A n=1 Tax=Hibiscus syriacus TaxID=106335 RepID=UPI00192133FC|nr:kinesin-like protein KIN-13A [Hibiscus syriacus]